MQAFQNPPLIYSLCWLLHNSNLIKMDKQHPLPAPQHEPFQHNQYVSDESVSDEENEAPTPLAVIKNSSKPTATTFVYILLAILIVFIIAMLISLFGASNNLKTTKANNVSKKTTKIPSPYLHPPQKQQKPSVSLLVELDFKKKFEKDELRKQTDPSVFEKNPMYWQTDANSQFSQFYNEKGELVTLRYRKPEIFRPEKVNEQEPGQIGQIDVELTKTYIDLQKDHGSLIYSFVKRRNEEIAHKAEYLYYSKRYNIDQYHKELPLCILSPFKNFFKIKQDGQRYLQSLNNQNYSNFEVIMIDDMSKDKSTEKLLNISYKYPRLNNRLTIVKNVDHTGALGNRDLATRKLCRNDSIIVEVDADDYLIGRQVFNIYNTYYQEHPSLWFLYSNFIYMKKNTIRIGSNKKIGDKYFDENSYRFQMNYWVTVHLRSYLKQVYMKIPPSYYLQEPDRYYLWASDRFNMYALTEISGKNHTDFLPEEVYFYKYPNDRSRPNCELSYIRETDYACRKQVPLLPLQSLIDQTKLTQNYEPPEDISNQYKEETRKLNICMQKFHLTKDTISKSK